MSTIINGSSPSLTFSDGSTQSSGINTTAGVIQVTSGGTGAATLTANNVLLGNGTSALQAVAPGTSGNLLTSNGTTWVSSAAPAGGVTSAVAGNGIAVSGATGAVTFSAAAPTFNSVGSYAFGGTLNGATGTFTSGSNYSAGSANNQFVSSAAYDPGCNGFGKAWAVTRSGTWKWMGASVSTANSAMSVICRVA